MSKSITYIKRHKKGFIYFHWINAVTFFLLFLTGQLIHPLNRLRCFLLKLGQHLLTGL